MNADLACQHALDRLAKLGFDALTEKEKTLATVWKLQSAVENGGFRHYYSTAAGDLAFHAPTALTEIGARHMAELAAKANAVVGRMGPSRDRVTRCRMIQHLSDPARQTLTALDEQFLKSPDDTNALLEAYLAR